MGADVLDRLVVSAGADQGGHAVEQFAGAEGAQAFVEIAGEQGLDLLDQELAAFGRQLQLFYDLPDPRTTPTIGPMSRPDSLRSNAGA